jgi:UDP-2-acetamido-3-amino-2,3-dideoxy-glucuronate N-acetyltransferase
MGFKIWHREKSVILTKKIGKGSRIHAPVWIGKDVVVGQNVKIQAFAFLPDGVKLEDNVFIGPGVIFTNDKYPPSDNWTETLVKEGASIGANCTILPGIRIGKKSLIGAGSVVLHDVPDGEVWVGNPARKIK